MLWLEIQRYRQTGQCTVEFSLPYTPSGVGLVVPVKDNVKRSSTIFLMPLTWGLCLLSLLSFFLIGLVVWVLEHTVNPDFDGPGRYQISTILWFSFSIMVFAPSMSTLSSSHCSTNAHLSHNLVYMYRRKSA